MLESIITECVNNFNDTFILLGLVIFFVGLIIGVMMGYLIGGRK